MRGISHRKGDDLLPPARSEEGASAEPATVIAPQVTQGVINPEGDLLTDPAHKFGHSFCTDEVRQHLALYSSGQAFITADVATHHAIKQAVRGVVDQALDVFPSLRIEEIVIDGGRLRGLYTKSATGIGEDDKAKNAIRREVYNVIDTASKTEGLSDVIVKYSPDTERGGRVVAIVDGVQVPLFEGKWNSDYCWDWMRGLVAWCHDGAGEAEQAWIDNAHQIAQLSKGLPAVLDSIRVQLIACGFSEKEMVLRFMPKPRDGVIKLELLGYDQAELREIAEIMGSARGIVLFVGPTGSGKTTSLHGGVTLSLELSPGDRWIMVEDPIEIRSRHDHITQVSVMNAADELQLEAAYREALRVAMRGIPKKLVIGEIRSPATAGAAISASQTGHVVLSSLHCDDGFGAIPRLRDMGVMKEILRNSETFRAIIAQRLVRHLCPKCKQALTQEQWRKRFPLYEPDWLSNIFTETPVVHVADPEGCKDNEGRPVPECRHGYKKGRKVIVEIMRPDDKMLDLIVEGHPGMAIDYWLKKEEERQKLRHERSGATTPFVRRPITMREKAIIGIHQGFLDPMEVKRCINM